MLSLQEVARMSSMLVNERNNLVALRERYNRLFNNSIPVRGHYTKYQEFLQERAQYYACQVFRMDNTISRFVELADDVAV